MPWPPHPRPLSPVSRGRGEDFVFLVLWKSATAPLAPGRGEGTGVRGETTLSPTPWLPRHGYSAGCWSHAKTRRREAAKGNARGGVRCSLFGGRLAFDGIHAARPGNAAAGLPKSLGVGAVAGWVFPLTPDPSPPFHGGEGRIWCSVFEHEHEHEESPREVFVARAFQPEICPLRLGCVEIAARGWGAVGFTRSREAAK